MLLYRVPLLPAVKFPASYITPPWLLDGGLVPPGMGGLPALDITPGLLDGGLVPPEIGEFTALDITPWLDAGLAPDAITYGLLLGGITVAGIPYEGWLVVVAIGPGIGVEEIACSPTVPPGPTVSAYCCVETTDGGVVLDTSAVLAFCASGGTVELTMIGASEPVDVFDSPEFVSVDDEEFFDDPPTLTVATGAIFGELEC